VQVTFGCIELEEVQYFLSIAISTIMSSAILLYIFISVERICDGAKLIFDWFLLVMVLGSTYVVQALGTVLKIPSNFKQFPYLQNKELMQTGHFVKQLLINLAFSYLIKK
jgi:hypothetical protein